MRTPSTFLRGFWLVAPAIVVYLVAAPTFANACPESCLMVWYTGEICSDRAAVDTSYIFPIGNCRDFASYDIRAGELSVASEGWTLGPCGHAKATVRDDFTVGGLPAGTPLTITARFDVSFTANAPIGSATAAAGIIEEGANSAGINWGGHDSIGQPIDSTMTLTVNVIAGSPFRMEYFLSFDVSGGEGEFHGVFSFDGLPQDAVVTSCNGYVQGPVQIEAMSWGKVKAHYR